MPELEFHHEPHGDDPHGKRAGMLAAVLAVLLAVVTILSHRAHTEAVVMKTEANDQWAFFQAKSIKGTVLSAAHDLLASSPQGSGEAAAAALKRFEDGQKRYEEENKEIQAKAKESDAESQEAEHRALRFDLGEGLLEIGLVMTSMYFIARKNMFPAVGVIAGAAGALMAVAGLLAH